MKADIVDNCKGGLFSEKVFHLGHFLTKKCHHYPQLYVEKSSQELVDEKSNGPICGPINILFQKKSKLFLNMLTFTATSK